MTISRILSFGTQGSDVAEWQSFLIKEGFDLGVHNNDGSFGPLTHNATISWQKSHGLAGTGIVCPNTLKKVGLREINLSNPEEDPLVIKFKQAKNYTKANRTEIKWIVIHSMEAPEASTTAENVASWFASASAPKASAHFNIDDDSIVQSVKETDVAWHAPGANKYGIGLEHAGYARQTLLQWQDAFSSRMLKRSAKLSAKLCKDWNIPIKFIDAEGLKKGEKGITTHNEVTKAFKKSTHYDPGKNFPMDIYLGMVEKEE